MSAPTPAPGDDRPREGYYPDPSIPGYVRYWNGAAWVPGTSRPAPSDGEAPAPPPGAGPASAPVEETGPHFFDEDPEPQPPASDAQQGGRAEPASAWGADRARQSGFGADQDRRVSWGADPRSPSQPDGNVAGTDGTATIPPAGDPAGDVPPGGTFVFRRPNAKPGGTAASAAAEGGGTGRSGTATPGVPGPGGPVADEGTMTFRALSPRTGQQSGGTGAPGFAAGKSAADRAAAAQQAQPGPAAGAAPQPSAAPPTPSVPQQGGGPQSAPVGQAPVGRPPAGQAAQPSPAPAPAPAPIPAPVTSGPGGGQPSWAQQVHQLAGAAEENQPVAPWKPPVEDIFQAAARRQAAARPAGLGRRLVARLIDGAVVAGITAVAAVPLGTKAVDHINEKIDAARLSGETVTVWLLDGTTSVYFGVVLAVLLLSGVLYEALPTARWGRTLGKKLLGLEVRDIEAHEPPSFGAALRRWLVYCVPGLLGIGVVGVLWCLFDRPWRQCWHDKAARTFVAG